MPVSRRSRRSAAAEEDIEEDAASHRPADDDVEMHDEKSTGARAGRVKGKGKAKAGAQAEDDSEASDAVEEDGALPFDAEEFRRQPVNAQEGQKLSGMASDWAQMGALLKGNAFTILKNAASTIANEADGEDSKELEKLDVLMKEMIDIEVELSKHAEALSGLHQSIRSGDMIVDIVERYQKGVEERMQEYTEKTQRQKYAKSDAYFAFRQGIWSNQHPDVAMPPMGELLPREEKDVSDDDDDDIQVGGIVEDFKCPLTLTLMVEPVTSSVCNHSYSLKAVQAYLDKSRVSKKQCPASGCSKMISMNDLKPDKGLERRIKALNRRNERRDSDNSDTEVIE